MTGARDGREYTKKCCLCMKACELRCNVRKIWIPGSRFIPATQPIQVHSVGSGDVSWKDHGLLRSSCEHHRNLQRQHRCSLAGDVCHWRNTIKIVCVSLLSTMRVVVFWCLEWRIECLPAGNFCTPNTVSHKSTARLPCILRPASHGMISVPVLLCETAV